MPIYEYHCLACELTFESLCAAGGGQRAKACPRCRRRSPRVTSAFAIAAGVGRREEPAVSSTPAAPPLCMRHPEIPLLCHMDPPSAERFVAHVRGRGAEYDDRMAARAEHAKKRSERPPSIPEAAAHSHGHAHEHRHAHAHGRRHAHSQHH